MNQIHLGTLLSKSNAVVEKRAVLRLHLGLSNELEATPFEDGHS